MSSTIETWHEGLCDALYDAEDENTLQDLEEDYNTPLDTDQQTDEVLAALPEGMSELYRLFDGWQMRWSAVADSDAGGRLHFLQLQHIVRDQEGAIYEQADLDENDQIAFFKPFDLVTDEAQCGFLMNPGYTSHSIYYHRSGLSKLYDLDLNFKGYLDMALASRIYYYWPKVLLDIQAGEESVETTNFKENMPQVFPNFSWDAYVAQYQALRLSQQ